MISDPLLIDWRAPAARPFYLATAVSPEGVTRRRHLRTKGRELTGIDDEVLDLAAGGGGGREDVTGEAALLSALTAGRTGRMRDIVETIQAEQDEVIRAGLPGVLVVQGGPGTGKTAVALHRAAYLLYTHRAQLTRQGVLILGPNATFLRYISQVLPSLAETGVLLATLGDMFPGVRARAEEPPATAALKGRPGHAGRAGRGGGRLADRAGRRTSRSTTTGIRCGSTGRSARTPGPRPAGTGRPHNIARPIFVTEVIHALSLQIAERIGADPLGGENLLEEADLAETRRELREDEDVQAALFEMWPVLTPRRVLRELLGSRGAAGRRPALPEPDAAAARPARGVDAGRRAAARRAGRAARRGRHAAQAGGGARSGAQAVEYAEGVLEIVAGLPVAGLRGRGGGDPLRDRRGRRERVRRAVRGGRHAGPRPSGPPPTGPGSSGTSSWTRRRSCRRWPGGC